MFSIFLLLLFLTNSATFLRGKRLLVAHMTSEQIILAIIITTHRHHSLFTINITNAYLNSEINVRSLYMRQLKGFEDLRYPTSSGWAYRLLKSLYGLK